MDIKRGRNDDDNFMAHRQMKLCMLSFSLSPCGTWCEISIHVLASSLYICLNVVALFLTGRKGRRSEDRTRVIKLALAIKSLDPERWSLSVGYDMFAGAPRTDRRQLLPRPVALIIILNITGPLQACAHN